MTTRGTRRAPTEWWGLVGVAVLASVIAILQKAGVVGWGAYENSLTYGTIFVGGVTALFTFHTLRERGRTRSAVPGAAAAAVLAGALLYTLVEHLI